MGEIFLREKEFLKLNAELNIKAKAILEKPEPKSLIDKIRKPSKSVISNNKSHEDLMEKIDKISNLPSSTRSNGSKFVPEQKPPVKPRPWHTKANTIPRENSDVTYSLTRKVVRERELRKLNEEINSEAQDILDNVDSSSVQEEFSEKNSVVLKSSAPSSVGQSSVAVTPLGSVSRKSSYVIETYRSHKFSRNPSLEDVSKNGPVENPKDEINSKTTTISRSESRASRDSVSSTKKPPLPEKPLKKNISSDGLIKFLKSKVAILQDELDSMTADLTKKVEELEKSYEILKKLETQRDQAISKNNTLTGQMQKMEGKLEELENKLKQREIEFTATSRETENLKREMKLISQANTNLEKRLYRANEELENVKNSLASVKDAEKELKEATRHEKEGFERQTKVLRKQRTDLLTAYKKQLYLLDNLKRQNNCLEQARIISFAEKEFTKVLEWNTKT